MFELPISIELCHLNKMLVKAHFMNKSIICLKISHYLAQMNWVDQLVAIREHKCAIFIQSEKCTSSGNVVKCQSVRCEKSFVCEVCHTYSVWRILMPWEQLWYNALDNNRTVNTVEDRQPICVPRCVHN